MQKPIFPLKFSIQTELVRLRALTLFLSLEVSMLFLSNVMPVHFRLLSTGAELDNSVGEESQKKQKWADPTTDLRCFEITLACLSWPEEASDCHQVPTQGVRAAYSSVALSLIHHIYLTVLAEKQCFRILLIWQQPHNHYGSSRICAEQIQPQLK